MNATVVSTYNHEHPNIPDEFKTPVISNAAVYPFIKDEDFFRHIHGSGWKEVYSTSAIKKRYQMRPPKDSLHASVDRSQLKNESQTWVDSFERFESTPTASGKRKVYRFVLVGQIDQNTCQIVQAPSITGTSDGANITNLYHCNLFTGLLSDEDLLVLADNMKVLSVDV
jgi:hypothetical protein